jgi:hypothetical protein
VDIKIDYDGSYPNLCSGLLVVTINETRWVFPSCCMQSGGRVSFSKEIDEEVSHGPWSISNWPRDFPEEMKDEVLREINSVVRHGCCGGCV